MRNRLILVILSMCLGIHSYAQDMDKVIEKGLQRARSQTFLLAKTLPPTDAFWSDSYMPLTNLKAWQGVDIGADHALRDSYFPINKK